VQYPATTDFLQVIWFIKCWSRCLNFTEAKATQSQTKSEAISDACLHLSHLGLSTRAQSVSCPFKWQCPVSSPILVHSLFLLKLSNSNAFFFGKGSLKKTLGLLLSMNRLPIFLMILHAPYFNGCRCLLNNEDHNFFAFYIQHEQQIMYDCLTKKHGEIWICGCVQYLHYCPNWSTLHLCQQ